MNRCKLLLVMLFCAAMTIQTSFGETFSLDYSTEAKKVVPRTNDLSIRGNVPNTDLQGWKFDWDANQGPYVEYWFPKAIQLPSFSSAVVRAKFWAPVGCPARSIAVRFRDKDGEILQYHQDVRMGLGGEFEVVWPIAIDNPEESWGCEKLNRIIDMPAQLHAITVSFHSDFAVSYVYLLNLSVETAPVNPNAQTNAALIEATRPLCLLTDSDKFIKLWGNGDFAVEPGVLKFDNVRSPLSVRERKFEIRRFEKAPIKLVFDTELLAGQASIAAVFLYADKADFEANGQPFPVPPVSIPLGRGKTTLDLTDALKEAARPVRIQRFDIIPAKSSEPVQARIRGIEIVEQASRAQAVDFEVLTDTSVHVLTWGNENSLKFRFVNRGGQAGAFTIDLEYENFFGERSQERLETVLNAGEAKDLSAQWRPASLGHWNIKATIAEKSESAFPAVKKRSIAWIKPSGPTPQRASGFLFSVCTHTERWSAGDRRQEIESAALCGVKVVRLGCSWSSVEPAKGDWKWDMFDELVENYAQKGIEPQVILCSTPTWAVPKTIADDKSRKAWKNFPADINDWKNYAFTMGRRYKGRVRFYENWNEPDLIGFCEMTLDQYVSLQKAAFEALREADPDAIVLSGGFATLSRHYGLIYPEFHRDFLLAAKGAFDVHAIHEHGWFGGYKKRIGELFLPLRKQTGTTVPWYSNETAMTSVGGLEKRQAETLFKKLLFAWARGSIGYTWYDLRNDGYDPRYGEHHFGMVTNDFYPKEVYSVYNMLATYYSSMKTAVDYSPDTNACLYEFSDGTDILLPGWSESRLGQTRQFVIETDAKSAKLVDIMGNETPAEIRDGKYVYDVGLTPQTLKLENCTFGKPTGELVKAADAEDLVPGLVWTLPLTVFNPLNRDATFSLSLPSSIPGLVFDPNVKSIKASAGQKVDCTFSARVTADFNRSSMLPISYQLEGSGWSGILFYPLKPAYWLESEYSVDRPNFTLNQGNQVTPLTPADPNNAFRLWKGAKDASANVWLAATGDALKIRIAVEDDQESLANEIPVANKTSESNSKGQSGNQGKINQGEKGEQKDAGDQVRIVLYAEKERKQESETASSDDYIEIALAKLASGKTTVQLLQSGSEANSDPNQSGISPEKLESESQLTVDRVGTLTTYEASFPWSALNITRSQLLSRGVRLDVLLGDDDGANSLDNWLHSTSSFPDRENMKKAFLFLLE